MKIHKYPDPVLLLQAQPVEITDDLKKWCKEAEEFCDKVPAKLGLLAGMAAPQLGRSIRAFVLHNYLKEKDVEKYTWFINPVIYWKPKGGATMRGEGCYSLEALKSYRIDRQYAIKIRWQDLEGNWHDEKFKHDKAQIIQHEYDHLDGLLCNRQENEKLENKTLNEWAQDYGYRLISAPSEWFMGGLYTEVEALAIINDSTLQRLPDFENRKKSLAVDRNQESMV